MNRNLRYLFVTLGIGIVGLTLWYFKSIVAYILISAVLSLIGRPIINFLNKLRYKKFKIPNAISALLTLVLFWTLLTIFFRIFIPLIANQASELSNIDAESVVENLQGPIEKIEEVFVKFNISSDGNKSMDQYLTEKFMEIVNVSVLSDFFSSIAGILGNIFIAVFSISFITFFLLKDKGLLYDAILLLVPDKYLENIEHI
ncbi:MAG: AI-2E family transporter, partial [Bacteroidales bacterium]|nr:AI-2E family transporter [Bacteroidales bacterium]